MFPNFCFLLGEIEVFMPFCALFLVSDTFYCPRIRLLEAQHLYLADAYFKLKRNRESFLSRFPLLTNLGLTEA